MRTVAGRYRLETRIGSGAAGSVWAGRDTMLDREVAVKIVRVVDGIDDLRDSRARSEYRFAARLEHPNIVRMLDIFQTDGELFLVMELLDGESLDHVLLRRRLDIGQSCAVGVALGTALDVAHRAGIVHRDVKPSNVVLCRSGRVVLLDFGIAVDSVVARNRTATGHVIGTPLYMAPETIAGYDIGAGMDVYALGCIVYRMLRGRLPEEFDGRNVARVLMAKVSQDIAPLTPADVPGIPQALVRLVGRMLERDPTRRPSASACASALAEWSDEIPLRGLLVDIEHTTPIPAGEPSSVDRTSSTPRTFLETTGLTVTGVNNRSVGDLGAVERPWWATPGLSHALLDEAGHAEAGASPHSTSRLPRQPSVERIDSRFHEAVALAKRGELLPALRLQEDIAELRATLLGADHPLTLASRFWVAWCVGALGEHDRAGALLRRVAEQTETSALTEATRTAVSGSRTRREPGL
ncbi:protein kinase [Embleya sp. NPDC050493]|uniref:serine/threonine-protein kinase n=1 Tax=Embleya sp. NPDC050493 TaxID=3363989 RepID=UPI0037B0A649